MLWLWWCRLLGTLSAFAWTVYAEELDPIVWSLTNPIFRKGMLFIAQVKIEDTIDIMCPLTPNTSAPKPDNYHIYLVERNDYVNCDARSGRRLLTCDEPSLETKFTFLFAQLSPIPNDFTFEPCRDYHLISTSNVTEDMDSGVGGVCATNNMKLIIRVSCSVPTYTVGTGDDSPTKPLTKKPVPKTEPAKSSKLPHIQITPSTMSGASSAYNTATLSIHILALLQILWLIT